MRNIHKYMTKLWGIAFIGIVLFITSGLLIQNPVYAKGDSTKENTEMMPFYWMIFIVGGCIAITLTYVSWRKYRGEKKKGKKKGKMID
ncbi:sporulation protein YpjB [Oceanobacillus limi]|uniref:Sporulation protein YpjB n=1 Tax=Oceanobacillus limi TaxID=930131 RepID=A0A1H9ZF73_9BACI|nr:sporulation protein YpjB [Oceanobacillus limi]SES80300.1 sporulation protein YpjB [Oceanobacillus limi]